MTDEVAAPEGSTVSWREFMHEATQRLHRAGVESPAVDARRIVERAAGFEPAELHQSIDRPATRRAAARFDELVARRERGEPLQYVIGQWGFRTLDLHVDRRVLIPRPETEVVAGLAIAEVEQRAGCEGDVLVADLGTGSGAIALAVAVECPQARVYATDRSAAALAVAGANLSGLGRAATRVTIHEGIWFDALSEALRGRLDVVVTNPPYVADAERLPDVVADWEPCMALRAGPKGTEDIEALIETVGEWLRPDGVFIVELAPHQAASMAQRARALGYDTTIRSDLTGRDRALVARR
jgi:release factor glutamine methyltransferase